MLFTTLLVLTGCNGAGPEDTGSPGVLVGTRIWDCCAWRFGLSGSVLPITIMISQVLRMAPLI